MVFKKYDPDLIIKGYEDANLPSEFKKDVGDLINRGVLKPSVTNGGTDLNTHFEMPLGLLIVLCLAHRDVMAEEFYRLNKRYPS